MIDKLQDWMDARWHRDGDDMYSPEELRIAIDERKRIAAEAARERLEEAA